MELYNLIVKEIKENGNKCDLNFIDISHLESLNQLFSRGATKHFNGDISKWNTSNITSLMQTFEGSDFDGDISKWNVSKVENMDSTFADCNVDISKLGKWKIGKVHGSRTQKRGFADGNPTYKKAYENDTLPKWCGKSKSEVDAIYKKLAKTKGSQDDSMAKYYDSHPTDF